MPVVSTEQRSATESGVNPFTAELVIRVTPSRLLRVFILATHLCVGGVLLSVPGLDFYWRVILLAAVCLSGIYYFLLHNNHWPQKTVQTLYWREFGGWELTNAQGAHVPVILRDSSFSSLYGSVLNFKTRRALGGQRYSVILLPDNTSLAIRRHLRRRMKLYRADQSLPESD